MNKLTENIHNFEHYKKEFTTWEATEQIIDDNKAFWMLRKPGSQYQKICLYRDGCVMFVYGDYGQFTFDSMTWKGDVYNLEYDNIGYQMEKLNYESKQSLKVFDDDYCREDILDWFEENVQESFYDIADTDEELDTLISKAKENLVDYSFDVDEFCEKYKCEDLRSLLDFTDDLLANTDEYEWISYLRSNTDRLQEFDEPCESSLWNAGKRINQRYFICMYALEVCGEKLKEQKGE